MPPRIYEKLERIDWFVDRLGDVDPLDKQRIWSLCSTELRHLKSDRWVPAGAAEPKRGYALTTRRSVLRDYRTAVRQRLGSKSFALEFLRISFEDQRSYQGAYHLDLKKEQRARRPIDAEELIATATAVLHAVDKLPQGCVLAALELLTGRRGWELAKLGRFARARRRPALLDGAGKHVLFFQGQGKTKNSVHARHAYHIPVLADPTLIMEAFALLHAMHPQLRRLKTDLAYNRNEGKKAGRDSKRIFADAAVPNRRPLSPKDLRECYAAISYAWYAPDESTVDVWISDILGHNDEDVTTMQSYKGFYLLGQKQAFERDIRASANERIAAFSRKQKAARNDDRRRLLEDKMRLFRAIAAK